VKNLQAEEIKRSGINSLKIGFNKVFGYYIEITRANLRLVPSEYIRKQTLVNAERFITPQLKEFEEKMLTAQDKVLQIEAQLLRGIQKELLDNSAALHRFSSGIATVDVLYSLAQLARLPGYIAPEINETSPLLPMTRVWTARITIC
jgi:DNA mismatch repair protein MutS